MEIANAELQDMEQSAPSQPLSLLTVTHTRPAQLSQPLVRPSQSLQTRGIEYSDATVSTLSQPSKGTSRVEVPFAARLDLPGWQEGSPLFQQRDI